MPNDDTLGVCAISSIPGILGGAIYGLLTPGIKWYSAAAIGAGVSIGGVVAGACIVCIVDEACCNRRTGRGWNLSTVVPCVEEIKEQNDLQDILVSLPEGAMKGFHKELEKKIGSGEITKENIKGVMVIDADLLEKIPQEELGNGLLAISQETFDKLREAQREPKAEVMKRDVDNGATKLQPSAKKGLDFFF